MFLTKHKRITMSTRLQTNPNLTLHSDRYFNGMQVQVSNGPLILNYLESMDQVIQNAVSEHPRTIAIRIDLRLPKANGCLDCPNEYDNSVMSKFIDSLKAQVNADQARRRRLKKRHFTCSVRVIWVAEHDSVMQNHYHIVIFKNNDCYNLLGDITAIDVSADVKAPLFAA
ncbi:MAG: hypothetical protein ACI9LM_002292 [Alteromonadaceae bacterium]|jgi:hypothetical protein